MTELTDRFARYLCKKMDRWTLHQHRPLDLNGSAVCRLCEQDWPCPTAVRLVQRLTRSMRPR